MASAQGNLIAFETALDQRGIRYQEMEDSKVPALRIGYSLSNIDHLDVYFWFDDIGTTLHYATGVITHVPEDKTDVGLRAVNQLNVQYRWLSFYLDSDNDVLANADAIILQDVVGDQCYELLQRAINITDEAYAVLMKAIWSSD